MNNELLRPYQILYSLGVQDEQVILLSEKSIADERDSTPPLPNNDGNEIASFLKIQGGRNGTSHMN